MKNKEHKENLHLIRKDIQRSHLLLIISITLLISFGGTFINISANEKSFNQTLQDTAQLISRQYEFTKDLNPKEQIIFLDSIAENLSYVDRISIVNDDLIRLYHTDHSLIGKTYIGSIPVFSEHTNGFYTEDTIGPSGPQRRAYSELYDENGNHNGFIMTIMLKNSMRTITLHTIMLFAVVTGIALFIEIIISQALSRKIKKQFLDFAEDLEGTKFLVDSMRANNHDFTNKLHVILGLLQIGEYEKAEHYIENISIIQRETVSTVMKAIGNASFAALLIGKIARASECNVRFILKEETHYNNDDISLPSEALVTITGNLIDNALDEMNSYRKNGSINDGNSANRDSPHELTFGVLTSPGKMLITVQDNGNGIPPENYDKIFENGFSTKGTGRGVGLYHTKQLVESLGGTISFESQIGQGTCFIVSITK